jgi:hypothetical protein
MHWASGIPARPLFGGGNVSFNNSGASRRENANSYLIVIASEAKQSSFLSAAPWIALLRSQ